MSEQIALKRQQLLELASDYISQSAQATDAMAAGNHTKAFACNMSAQKAFYAMLHIQQKIHVLQADEADRQLRLVH